MPAAAVSYLDNDIHEETLRTPVSPAEHSRVEPKFRVVTRKPLVPQRRRRSNPVRNALVLAALPTCCLLAYVLCWTMAIRGGFMVDKLQQDISRLRIEQAEARAEKLARQSPGEIFAKARLMGMQPAEDNKRYIKAVSPKSRLQP